MENIKLWQYFVIAGPAFMAGFWLAYSVAKDDMDRMRFIEKYVLKMTYGQDKISQNVMDGIAADAVYGREDDI